MRRTFLILALILAALPAYSQTGTGTFTNVMDFLSSRNQLLTMKLKDLNSDWIKFTAPESLTSRISASGPVGRYYTKGDAITIGGETYLIAYAVKSKVFDPRAYYGPGRPPVPEPEAALTGDTTVYLSLLNLRTTGSLTDIHPFDIQEETAAPPVPEVSIAPTEPTGPAPVGPAPVAPAAQSLEATSLSNLKQLGLALQMYMQDWNEVLPSMDSPSVTKDALLPYVKNDAVFINPITNNPYIPNAILSKHAIAHIEFPAQMVAFYEDEPAPTGTRGICFLDGHALRIPETEWPRLKKASKIQ